MSKKALDILASYIGKKVKESSEYRELESNYKAHEFTLSIHDLILEMQKQLYPVKKYARINGKPVANTTFDSILSVICSDAQPKILNAVLKASRVYDIAQIDMNTIVIYSTRDGQDIFRFIVDRYRPVFKTEVTDKIVTQLFNSFNETRSYKKFMKQSFSDYNNPTTAYSKKTHELNRAIFGYASKAEVDKDGNTLDYKRKDGTIVLSGGSGNLGHINSVAQQRAAAILDDVSTQLNNYDSPLFGTLQSAFMDMPNIVIDIIKDINIRRNTILSGPLNQNVQVTIHSARDNQERGRTEDKEILQKLTPRVMYELRRHSWAKQEASDSYLQALESVLINSSIDILTKNKNNRLKSGKKRPINVNKSNGQASTKGTKGKNIGLIKGSGFSRKLRAPKDQSPIREPSRKPVQNWSSLLPIINAKLPPRVMANMRFPSLVNRTGTFASSASVVGVEQTREGFPSFVFDYERNPYNVFDRTLGRAPWNTPERDPSALVDKSLREIVREMAIGRFYTRRA